MRPKGRLDICPLATPTCQTGPRTPRTGARINERPAHERRPGCRTRWAGRAFGWAAGRAHGVFDTMGRDSHAGQATYVAVAARPQPAPPGHRLVTTSGRIEGSLIEHFGQTTYVTAVLGDVNADTGLFNWINRSRHAPALIRVSRWTNALSCPPAHPLSTAWGLAVTLRHEQLEPGERILLHTAVITEASARPGRPFVHLLRHPPPRQPCAPRVKRGCQHGLPQIAARTTHQRRRQRRRDWSTRDGQRHVDDSARASLAPTRGNLAPEWLSREHRHTKGGRRTL